MKINIEAVYMATIITILLIVSMTVIGELYSPFKDFLEERFTHHWIGKGAISTAAFVLVIFLYAPKDTQTQKKLYWKPIKSLVTVFILSSIILIIFFTAHYIGLI